MKGFWGTFIIFILWASASIYYVHTKEQKSNPKESTSNTVINEESMSTQAAPKIKTPALPVENEVTLPDTTTTDSAFNEIEDNTLYIGDNTNVDSQLLAEEIKKSIAISDTIDIDKDEPKIEYKKEVTTENNSTTNTAAKIFYPRYANTDLILDKELIDYA